MEDLQEFPGNPDVNHANPQQQLPNQDRERMDHYISTVLSVFPDICPEYLDKQVRQELRKDVDIIDGILADSERGIPYPRMGIPSKSKKRKREVDPIVEMLAKPEEDFGPDDAEKLRKHFSGAVWRRRNCKLAAYHERCRLALSHAFPLVDKDEITKVFRKANHSLLASYKALSSYGYLDQNGVGHSNSSKESPVFIPPQPNYLPEELQDLFDRETSQVNLDVAMELFGARRMVKAWLRKAKEEREEKENTKKAIAAGAMRDCGCCFTELPMNRMVTCNLDMEHFFCIECARMNAETQIGMSKYQLMCMSTDGCEGEFSPTERKLFMTKKLLDTLDRLEQQAALRTLNLDNLATCPSCDFAAECPPVEEDREFRCLNPECKLVSCRLCQQETHVPKTCEEAAADKKAPSARLQIEEAMSAALIRKCNKCKTPFIKELGCNKMTCTAAGCRNVQCYICSKSCDYDHFDDTSRGGKPGSCPLFDKGGLDAMHDAQVAAAEQAARNSVVEQNPDLDPKSLEIKMSAAVQESEKKKKKRNQGHRHLHYPRFPAARHAAPVVHAPPTPAVPAAPGNIPAINANPAPQAFLGGPGYVAGLGNGDALAWPLWDPMPRMPAMPAMPAMPPIPPIPEIPGFALAGPYKPIHAQAPGLNPRPEPAAQVAQAGVDPAFYFDPHGAPLPLDWRERVDALRDAAMQDWGEQVVLNVPPAGGAQGQPRPPPVGDGVWQEPHKVAGAPQLAERMRQEQLGQQQGRLNRQQPKVATPKKAATRQPAASIQNQAVQPLPQAPKVDALPQLRRSARQAENLPRIDSQQDNKAKGDVQSKPAHKARAPHNEVIIVSDDEDEPVFLRQQPVVMLRAHHPPASSFVASSSPAMRAAGVDHLAKKQKTKA